MLQLLSGRTHQVISAVSLVGASGEWRDCSFTSVTFGELTDAVIERYVATGEAFGKAGAYGIQGAAEVFVSRLEGSYSGVMGLPLYETDKLLRQAGVIA
ncbi:Maf-like protein [Lysobacter spongiicola DSM 21749]|uniref:Maf-like protein n=1 Tax=Lysobacter spongiicola DSM 21749 TaxID=1122188 RepID=A0A1T4N463_9GAMM|nr:Maf-like protein [Lysobacter spongiicola DSM 21749]